MGPLWPEFAQKGKINPGQKVFDQNGASGGIGAAATQLAKAIFGAR